MKRKIEEAVPKSVKDRIFRRLRPNKLTPPQMVPKGRVVPKKTADHTPKIYKHHKEEEEEMQEEANVPLQEAEGDLPRLVRQLEEVRRVVSQYQDIRKQMVEVDKVIERLEKWLETTAASLGGGKTGGGTTGTARAGISPGRPAITGPGI